MANYEAHIQTRFGQLTIHFDSVDELVQRIKALDVSAISDAVQEHFSGIIVSQPRQIKPLLTEICAFTPDGGLEFLKPPKEKLEAIAILLYAFDPEPVEVAHVKRLAGVNNPVGYLGHKKYEPYFEKVSRGLYRLSHKGKLWVTNDVIPKLTAKPERSE